MITAEELDFPADELKLWLQGKRSTNNFIVGTLNDPEAEAKLIAESDNARITALAVLVVQASKSSFPWAG